MTSYDWVLAWPRGDVDFDLRVGAGESRQGVLDEGVHASRGSGPVTVMEVEASTLEDERAQAVLEVHVSFCRLDVTHRYTPGLAQSSGSLRQASAELLDGCAGHTGKRVR